MRSGNAAQLNRQESISLQAALFMQRVYGWMTLGLIITGISSFYIASSQSAINFIFCSSMSILLIFGVQLGIVFAIRPAMKSGGWQMGLLLFIVFSASLGVTVSSLLLRYTSTSVAQSFFVTSGAFGAMTIFAFVTKKDLSGWQNFLYVGLFGIIIAMVVNIFLASSALHFAISVIGVLVFAGLTAYDTQKMKQYAYSQDTNNEIGRRASVMAALELYLDFINMFIFLTHLLGSSRD